VSVAGPAIPTTGVTTNLQGAQPVEARLKVCLFLPFLLRKTRHAKIKSPRTRC